MVQYEYIYVSFLVSVLFFILKQIEYRSKPMKDQNKLFFRDSVYIFILVVVCLHMKDHYMKIQEPIPEIFTNQPSF
jgi:heme O synthase-like polyprenyltransferase